MKYRKLSLLVLLAVMLSVFAGCQSQRGNRTHTNVLGIYERETNSYRDVSESSIPLRRAEIDPAAEISGNRVSLLWGLFTYYDY